MSQTTIVPADITTWPCDTSGVDDAVLDAARGNAQAYLWALTGRRFGDLVTIDEVYRVPVESVCSVPYMDDHGTIQNGRLGTTVVSLRNRPVRLVQQVRLGASVVDPASYGLEAGNLVRYGNAVWPGVLPDQPPSLHVDYRWGVLPTPFHQAALEELGCELLAGVAGGPCKLPSRVTQITRQGVTMNLADAETFTDKGSTGLAVVDAFINTVNPHRLKARPRIASPDMPRAVR